MNDQILTKDIFCTAEQTTTSHTGEVDDNGEFVFTCTTITKNEASEDVPCGRFVKFAPDTTPEGFERLIVARAIDNAGQVDVSKQRDKLRALMGVTLQLGAMTPEPEVQATDESVPSIGTNEEIVPEVPVETETPVTVPVTEQPEA